MSDVSETELFAALLKVDGFLQRGAVARSFGVCVKCHARPKFTTEAGRREYQISGLCEPCWFACVEPLADDETTG